MPKVTSLILMIISLAGCSLYYHQSSVSSADPSNKSALVEEYGQGSYHKLSSGLDKIHRAKDGQIFGAEKEAESQFKESNICRHGYQILPKTYQAYEYGSVTIYIKCLTGKSNA